MTQDQTLAPDQPAIGVFGTPTPLPATPDTPLSLDEVLTQARLVERVVKICLRGDLYAEHTAAVEELAGLVDPDGNVLAEGDQALSDQSRAEELNARITDLADQMRAAMRSVRFRAMPDDEWRVFEKEHRIPDGTVKDPDVYHEQIIARCAIEPTFTVEQVKQIRGKLVAAQFMTLANGAFWACTTGGLDIPKSPTFLRTPTQQASGRS